MLNVSHLPKSGVYDIDLSGRTFTVWDASPTHSRLLLRSPAPNDNIDIVFWGIEHMNILSIMRELSIEVIETPLGQCNTYIICSNEGEFFIKAHAYKISTSEN